MFVFVFDTQTWQARIFLPPTFFPADIADSRTWSAAPQRTCKEPGNVSLLLTKQSPLRSCNRKPWAETSPGLPFRNPLTFSREESARQRAEGELESQIKSI